MNNMFSRHTPTVSVEVVPVEVEVASDNGEESTNANNSVIVNVSHILETVVSSATVTTQKRDISESQETSTGLGDKIAFKHKMHEILCCRICCELRRSPMYQCKYGHLICAGCFNDILAESRLQNEIASCPHCQATISKDLCFRNVAVEQTISELPISCPYCFVEIRPAHFKHHEKLCNNRQTSCSNSIIGCLWQGPNSERQLHEQNCNFPSATGYEILKSLEVLDEQQKEGMQIYNKIMELLSVEKMSYIDLQFKHCKTENENIFFETSKFSAFENQWVVCACCTSDSGKNISLTHQLVLKTKMNSMDLRYIILRGPYNDMEVKPKICHFKFDLDKAVESPYQSLELPRTLDKENFRSAKRINFRILMFILK